VLIFTKSVAIRCNSLPQQASSPPASTHSHPPVCPSRSRILVYTWALETWQEDSASECMHRPKMAPHKQKTFKGRVSCCALENHIFAVQVLLHRADHGKSKTLQPAAVSCHSYTGLPFPIDAIFVFGSSVCDQRQYLATEEGCRYVEFQRHAGDAYIYSKAKCQFAPQ